MDSIVIIGSAGHAKVIIDIVEREGRYKIAGLLDLDRKVGEQTLGYRILGREDDLPHLATTHAVKGVIVAIGDNHVRSKVAARAKQACPTLFFATAIHPRASVARDVSVGEGTVLMAGVTVNPCASIGRFCILNTNSSLDHDSVMEDFSSLGPGATTGGNCSIGGYSAIAIGAVLLQGIHVGEHAVLGAGSTALKNLDSLKVAYGTPARVVRDRKPGDKYL